MSFDPDNPVTTEIKRLADRLRAGERAALADPNLHPLRRKMFEASLAAAEAEDREDARQRAFEEAQAVGDTAHSTGQQSRSHDHRGPSRRHAYHGQAWRTWRGEAR